MNVLLGIGNIRHGDDALGPIFARAFRHPQWHSIPANGVPENLAAVIRRLRAKRLFLLDACDMGLPPGTIRWVDPEFLASLDFGCHAPSLGILMDYLMHTDAVQQVDLIGVQPFSLEEGRKLSVPVRQALRELARRLAESNFEFDRWGAESEKV